MPQSWPSQWVLIFLFSIMIFILVITLMFFIQNQVSDNKNMELNFIKKTLTWSW